MSKRIDEQDWSKVREHFRAERGAMAAAPQRRAAPKPFVSASLAGAEIGESGILIRLLVNPQDVEISTTEPALDLQNLTLNGVAVQDVKVRIGGMGATPGSEGQVSFSVTGVVDKSAVPSLKGSSMLSLQAQLSDSRLLEGYLRRPV